MKIPDHIQQAIQAYYAERATEDDIAALEDWLREDEANIRIFAEIGMVEWQILCETEKADVAAILTLLREAEEIAEPDFSLLHTPVLEPLEPKSDKGERSAHDLAAVTGYALRLALTSKPAKRIYAYIGVAAAVLLAFVLLSPWGDNETPTNAPLASDHPNDSIEPVPVDPPLNNPVATLTATHNAVWASQPDEHLRPGSALTAGQRLILTQGFAEITTNRGAIAILEAPTTIELLDSDNAIRLHTGKLVGICETESSKGFLVRTPHMDITDLGTRFGVAVEEQGNTLAEVFEGKVVAMSYVQRSGETATVELSRGESRVVDASGRVADRDLFPAEAFAAVPRADSGVAVLFGDADLAPRPIAYSDTAAAQKGRVTLYQELRGHRLASAIGLTFATPGQHNDFKETRSSVPAGTVIRTYILWHPNSGDENLARGRVTFEGEVLGAVANERDWQAFVDATPSAAERVCKSGRHAGLESVPADHERPNEQFTLSDDRRTLQFQFRSQNTDALRIIVREPAGDQP